MTEAVPILDVRDLTVSFARPGGRLKAVNQVSFSVGVGERFGLVGESGSGKSTTAMAILRLIRPPGRVEDGRVSLDGIDVLGADEANLQAMRWRRMAFVPQGSMNALNPVMRVGDQISDAIAAHERPHDRATEMRVATLLESVQLSSTVTRRYPHELSGGMRQRVCIAMAIALQPRLLIADEPTSALDVVVQRVVAETLLDATTRIGASLILIGHDLALQAQLVDRIAVMRAGRLVEIGPVRDIFREPLHPYTRALIAAAPSIRSRPRSIGGLPERMPTAWCALGASCDQRHVPTKEARWMLHDLGRGRAVACGAGEPAGAASALAQ